MMIREGFECDLFEGDLAFVAGYEKGHHVNDPIRWRFDEKTGRTALQILARAPSEAETLKMTR